MKTLTLFFCLSVMSHGATYWLLNKNVDGAGDIKKVVAANSSIFETDGSGNLVLTPKSTYLTPTGDGSGLTGYATGLGASFAVILAGGEGENFGPVTSAGFGGGIVWKPYFNNPITSNDEANYFDNSGFHGDGSNLTGVAKAPAVVAVGAADIDWSLGTVFTKTLGGNTTFTFSNIVQGKSIFFRLTGASSFGVNWPAGITWAGASTPAAATAGATVVYEFIADSASTFRGFVRPQTDQPLPVNLGGTGNTSGNAATATTASTVTTNANLTGHITSTGNAAVLGSFTKAQLNTAVSDADLASSGANTDITSLTANTINAASFINFNIASTGKFGIGGAENTTYQLFKPGANNTIDLGASGTAFRTLYIGTSIVNSGSSTTTGTTTATGGLIYGTYTVAGFPTTQGLSAIVTDALAPVAGSAVVGGGSAKALVLYYGTTKTVVTPLP